MKYLVSFTATAQVDVRGPGALYLDETGLLLEGEFARFRIPFLGRFLRRIICALGHRTIPFSRIESYEGPSLSNGFRNRLVYRLPNRSKARVYFQMRRNRRQNNADLEARLAEYRASVRTLGG
jgi:hypothetical protein